MAIQESCSVCSKPFEVQLRWQMEERNGAFSFFCSRRCYEANVTDDRGVVCDACGKRFVVELVSQVIVPKGGERQHACSTSCRDQLLREQNGVRLGDLDRPTPALTPRPPVSEPARLTPPVSEPPRVVAPVVPMPRVAAATAVAAPSSAQVAEAPRAASPPMGATPIRVMDVPRPTMNPPRPAPSAPPPRVEAGLPARVPVAQPNVAVPPRPPMAVKSDLAPKAEAPAPSDAPPRLDSLPRADVGPRIEAGGRAEAAPRIEGGGRPEAGPARSDAPPRSDAGPSPKADAIPRRIAVFNHKGGTGKTTTAVSVAASLANRGKRVLLVDTDAQGNVAASLGLRCDRSLYHVLVMGLPPAEAAQTVRANLDVLGSNETLAAAELYLAGRRERDRVLRDRLASTSQLYDVVILDCSPSLSLLNQNALVFAEGILVPVACDYLSLVGVRQVLRTVKHVNQLLQHPVRITGVVPTMYDARAKICQDALATLREHFGPRCLPPVRATSKIKEAPAHQQTIFEWAGDSHGAKDYEDVVDILWRGIESEERPIEDAQRATA